MCTLFVAPMDLVIDVLPTQLSNIRKRTVKDAFAALSATDDPFIEPPPIDTVRPNDEDLGGKIDQFACWFHRSFIEDKFASKLVAA